MSATTQCIKCNTRFRITPEQFEAHHGLVRCGRCHEVFNAVVNLQDDDFDPQPASPPVLDATKPQAANATITPPAGSTDLTTHEVLNYLLDELARTEDNKVIVPPIEVKSDLDYVDKPISTTKLSFHESSLDNVYDGMLPELPERKSTLPWAIGSLLLSVTLLAQAAYFFRVDIAALQPGLKPYLLSYCRLLNCTIPLPQKADLMSIESSELEADPALPNVLSLNILLRNHATYAQSFPNLELTLTDAQDNPMARRTFRPEEYLKPEEDEKQGIASNRELAIKINLNTADLKPLGYRLFLFYSQ